jgi:hypothetical protein
MARARRRMDAEGIQRQIAEGYGQGHGSDYKPWLPIQRASTRGHRWRVQGWTHQRAYHLYTEAQQRYFYILDLAPGVTEIREQFPLLPLEATLAIAERLGVEHPREPGASYPRVLVTDFLVTAGGVEHPRVVCDAGALEHPRLLEILEIARLYWAERNCALKVVTEQEASLTLARNAVWLHALLRLDHFPQLHRPDLPQIAQDLAERLIERPGTRLSEVALGCDAALGLRAGESLLLARHLLASQQWLVDPLSPLGGDHPLALRGVALHLGTDVRA